MASSASFKLSPQEPGRGTLVQLEIWLDELGSYEHELSTEMSCLGQMVRRQYSHSASAAVRQYRELLGDVRHIKEMFERRKHDIKSHESSERPAKRAAR